MRAQLRHVLSGPRGHHSTRSLFSSLFPLALLFFSYSPSSRYPFFSRLRCISASSRREHNLSSSSFTLTYLLLILLLVSFTFVRVVVPVDSRIDLEISYPSIFLFFSHFRSHPLDRDVHIVLSSEYRTQSRRNEPDKHVIQHQFSSKRSTFFSHSRFSHCTILTKNHVSRVCQRQNLITRTRSLTVHFPVFFLLPLYSRTVRSFIIYLNSVFNIPFVFTAGADVSRFEPRPAALDAGVAF